MLHVGGWVATVHCRNTYSSLTVCIPSCLLCDVLVSNVTILTFHVAELFVSY